MIDRTVRAHALFHRAYVVLIPAATLSWMAYRYGFRWFLTAPAILLWAVAIYLLKRGSERWREERGSDQSR
jgi:hypothetical protein